MGDGGRGRGGNLMRGRRQLGFVIKFHFMFPKTRIMAISGLTNVSLRVIKALDYFAPHFGNFNSLYTYCCTILFILS